MNNPKNIQVGDMLYDWNRDTIGWIVDIRDISNYEVTYFKVEFADGLTRHASINEINGWMQDYAKLEQGGSRRIRI
jgi:hypothetical protein